MSDFKPFWEKKAWGRVHHFFSNGNCSCSYLEVMQGTCCSKHFHRNRNNLFCVVSGAIVIEQWDWISRTRLGSLGDLKLLTSGDIFTVPAYRIHRFRVIETGMVIEAYTPRTDYITSVELDDIVRFDEGGPDDQTQLRQELGI